MGTMLRDRRDVSPNLLEYGFDVDLVVRVVRELDVQYRVELARGDPGYGPCVAGGVLRVLDREAVNAEAGLQVSLTRHAIHPSPAHHPLNHTALVRSSLA
jgi:hypothetical protein